MRRTFNYTGRRRIPLDFVTIRVYAIDSGARWFDADLSRLCELRLPENARVFVEAYFERAYRRFDFGTVCAIQHPEDRSLEEIDFGGRMRFRVKITDLPERTGNFLQAPKTSSPRSHERINGPGNPCCPSNHALTWDRKSGESTLTRAGRSWK